MKSSTIFSAALTYLAVVSAAPTPSDDSQSSASDRPGPGPRWSWGKWSPWGKNKSPFEFSSTYFVKATPDQVVATNQTAVPGQKGAIGYYNFGINSKLDTICYNITLVGVQGDYQSPAKTATHVHEAVRGRAGPPRLAFPNPVADAKDSNIRRSAGCLTGPFTTGIVTNGTDTGAGFKVAQIEANPAGFFADVHTVAFVSGAIRGQLG